MRKRWIAALAALALVGCTGDDSSSNTTTPVETVTSATSPESTAPDTVAADTTDLPFETAPPLTEPVDTDPTETDPPDTASPDTTPESTAPAVEVTLLAGAASRSILPTLDGSHSFLLDAPGWDFTDPNDLGVFVPEWDQGRVDVGNGNSDGSWVHDDLRASALAIQRGDQLVVMVASDVYMIFAVDAAEIERRARAMLSPDVAATAQLIISATHNHHGPDTAFSINDDWYDQMADETARAIDDAVEALEPATVSVASGEHRFGVGDGRDPIVLDPRLNVLLIDSKGRGERIATVVQWASHPESTLGWTPPVDIAEQCAMKAWEGDDCTAEGRYFTADYPGVLRERLQASVGGEVLYFNGAIGNQIGPGNADVWLVDEEHPVGDGWTVPEGAQGVGVDPASGDGMNYGFETFARTEAIGEQLAIAVENLAVSATEVVVDEIVWREQSFYTSLTHIGFRLLLADGDLGWRVPDAYICSERPFTDETCVSDNRALVDDPVLTPLVGSQIREGDVLKARLVHIDLGDVGFLFLPGEVPPELVVGLPATFNEDPAPFYVRPELHAVGADYQLPGYLLELVDEEITFTVGLGGDELGYFVPITDVRLACLDLVLPVGPTCAEMFAQGILVTPDALPGELCRNDPPAAEPVYRPICRYGQALGRELGEPPGHYEETNSAGWELVDDLFDAAEALFGRQATSGGINPANPGSTPMNPEGSG